MGTDDKYDRSGQYSGGDTGPKVEGFGATGAFGMDADRRDVAIGTMMGEGGPRENRQGYGAVLDSIENRISAIGKGVNYNQKRDSTLQGVAMARKGGEYNAWSPKESAAYGHAKAGATGKPQGQTQTGMYDQARQVYDDYYDNGTFQGTAMGGTFYQNDALLRGSKAGAYQRDLQKKHGSMPVGKAGHVMTGPNYYGPGSPAGRDQSFGYEPFDPSITGNFGANDPSSSFSDPLLSDITDQQIQGAYGTNSFAGKNRDALGYFDETAPIPPQRPGKIGMRNPNVGPIPPQRPLSGIGTMIKGNVGRNNLLGGMMAPGVPQRAVPQRTAPMVREDFWTPGPVARAAGSNATGRETTRTRDGVIHDNAGAYGGGEAFGPNDPFGGLGFSNPGYADIVDSFDQDMGISRTVTDRQGNLLGQGFVSRRDERRSGSGSVLGIDGVRSDGRGTADTGMSGGSDGRGGGSVGDGSYSESSGRNSNNPQGIL
ncbi:hypothetical protein [Microvirga tunisiensis]|uniref:Uncharacterized protein n=1 Tax=Microvirga tunisiensis TaxID=2108360 RepID=A0A5N7N7F9_9HYPH|nr:hypothetical protein [Microvirga tunisiensis]MPR13115.1 hypothetical protein [Microvirga tunisiensis]MPR31006.1 hypothetical protein [Microvirga tunisiensis]